jgi:hypothetical protein
MGKTRVHPAAVPDGPLCMASPASRGSSGPLPVAGRSACPGSARRAARDRAVQDQPCTSAASPRAEEQDWQGEQMHGEGAEALASVLPAAGSRPRGLAAVRHVPRHSAQLWLCARSRTTWGTASPGSVWTRRGTRASTPTAGGAPLASSHGWRGRRFRATSRNRRSRLSTRLHRSARRDLVRPRRLVTGRHRECPINGVTGHDRFSWWCWGRYGLRR